MHFDVSIDGKRQLLELVRTGEQWLCRMNGQEFPVDAVLTRPDILSLLIAGRSYEVKRERTPAGTHLWVGSQRYLAEVFDPRSLHSRRAEAADEKGPRKLVAPMPGKVVRLLVAERDEVDAGQGIVVVEAMKMQNEIKSPKRGTVTKLAATEGASVVAGEVLAIVE